MNLTFLNHASYILNIGKSSILFDPYLYGSAFNNGWKLLTEEKHDVKDVNYIFYSHEHPDHFQVDFLKNNFSENRDEVTILYQDTYDKRIKTFCTNLGYSFIELPNKKELKINDDFNIICGKVPFYDSWVMVKDENYNLLNVNDCVLEDPSLVHSIKKYTKDVEVDVLLTQFSYASFYDHDNRAIRAKKQLETIKLQDDVLNPKNIIPFASFIYFSHEENFYMNDSINTPEDVEAHIVKNLKSDSIWLRPNENWAIGNTKDNTQSIDYWMQYYNSLDQLPRIKPEKTFKLNELEEKYDKYIKKIKSRNNSFLVSLYNLIFGKKINLYLYDIEQYVEISLLKGIQSLKTNPNNYIKLHTESLAFIFDFDYGIDTFAVAARFDSDEETFNDFTTTFAIGELNNTGKFLKFNNIYKFIEIDFIWRILKFFRKGVGN
tara:strand:- start:359 stop:1657 length:1299 start_codon:yes stop_codon:yes gene_type:complete